MEYGYTNVVQKIKEKQKKYGYIDQVSLKDKNGLTNIFNNLIERLYDNLCLYFDEFVVERIYPNVYNYLCNVLNESIVKGVDAELFKISFGDYAEYILDKVIEKNNIDILTFGCILSKGNFNGIQSFMLRNNFVSIIVGNDNNNDIKDRRDYVCQSLHISKTKYYIEALKMSKELLRLFKKENKIRKK